MFTGKEECERLEDVTLGSVKLAYEMDRAVPPWSHR